MPSPFNILILPVKWLDYIPCVTDPRKGKACSSYLRCLEYIDKTRDHACFMDL
jgi:hypothetical protein